VSGTGRTHYRATHLSKQSVCYQVAWSGNSTTDPDRVKCKRCRAWLTKRDGALGQLAELMAAKREGTP
jgi:hypothetical protein